MQGVHAVHELPRRVLGDDCEVCVYRASKIERLVYLDNNNLKRLGDLANETGGYDRPDDASWADMRAVDNLRLAARLVYTSGITEEAAN